MGSQHSAKKDGRATLSIFDCIRHLFYDGRTESVKIVFAKSQDWPAEMFRHNVLLLGGGTFSWSFSERKENIFDGRCTAQI